MNEGSGASAFLFDRIWIDIYVVHIRSLSIRGHIDDGNLKKALK